MPDEYMAPDEWHARPPERVPSVLVDRRYARKLWLPHDGFRWPPPRLVQLGHQVVCAMRGHRWSPWTAEDYEGPGEPMEGGGFMPYLGRDARPDDPWAYRVCRRRCGAVENRRVVA